MQKQQTVAPSNECRQINTQVVASSFIAQTIRQTVSSKDRSRPDSAFELIHITSFHLIGRHLGSLCTYNLWWKTYNLWWKTYNLWWKTRLRSGYAPCHL